MPIYKEPVRVLMKDFTTSQNIAKGQIFTRAQMVA
jgi:hypothetical protein